MKAFFCIINVIVLFFKKDSCVEFVFVTIWRSFMCECTFRIFLCNEFCFSFVMLLFFWWLDLDVHKYYNLYNIPWISRNELWTQIKHHSTYVHSGWTSCSYVGILHRRPHHRSSPGKMVAKRHPIKHKKQTWHIFSNILFRKSNLKL